MTPAKAFDLIRAAATANRIDYLRPHAPQRMVQRSMTAEDVRALLMSRRSACSLSRDVGRNGEQRWCVDGFDLDDASRTVVVQISDSGVLVVTVYP